MKFQSKFVIESGRTEPCLEKMDVTVLTIFGNLIDLN